MVQVPAVTKVRVEPLTVHTPVVDELKLTAKPDVELADKLGDVPKFCAPGLAKVIV